MTRITLRVATEAELALEAASRCGARPSPRSSARCEQRRGHETEMRYPASNFHAGRTRGGYWKFWEAT